MATWPQKVHLYMKESVYVNHAIVYSHHSGHHLFLFKPVQMHSVVYFPPSSHIMLNHLKNSEKVKHLTLFSMLLVLYKRGGDK